jgi:hypothetical protein
MKTKWLYTAWMVVLAVAAGAQNLPLTNEAAQKCQAGDITAAIALSEKAISSPEEMNEPFTWYVRCYIFKEQYKAKENQQPDSPARENAVTAINHCRELDKDKTQNANIRPILKFIATSYYNDALLVSKQIDHQTENKARLLFEKFASLMKVYDPAISMVPYENELRKSLGQHHYAVWEKDNTQSDEISDAIRCFNEILTTDSNNCDANYSMAIIYYNSAVFKIRAIGSGTDLMEIIMIQDECVHLFKSSLPYMEKVYSRCPQKADHFRGMMYVNRALGRDAEYEKYKAALEEAVKKGMIKAKD